MAERRMFAKTIIDSDAFLEMPLSSQLLYFHLSMRADDEGFINKPKTIMRMLGAKEDDMSVLILRKFIIPFDSGVVVIKHWRIHNYLQNDRLTATKYQEEKQQLELDNNKAYRVKKDQCIQNTGEVYTQVRLGKVSIGKDNKECIPKRTQFVKPTKQDIEEYLKTITTDTPIDVDRFIDYYEANGWFVGKNKMKDWKATLRNWGRKKMTPKEMAMANIKAKEKEEEKPQASDEELEQLREHFRNGIKKLK